MGNAKHILSNGIIYCKIKTKFENVKTFKTFYVQNYLCTLLKYYTVYLIERLYLKYFTIFNYVFVFITNQKWLYKLYIDNNIVFHKMSENFFLI